MNTNTPATNTFAQALRQSAMLVTLTTSTFGIQRTQRDLSDTIAAETKGTARAFAVRKNLLCGADQHQRDLVATIAAFRSFVYRKTLPFASTGSMIDRGPRIVANGDFLAIQEQLGIANAALRQQLDAFEATYADAIETARENLGSAFDPDDYPEFDEVRDSFRIDVEFGPLPSRGGFSPSLDASITMALDDEIEERQTDKALVAITAMRERASDLLARYRDRASAAALHDPADKDTRRPRITSSLFESATDVAAAITAFAPLTMLDPALGRIGNALYLLGAFDAGDLYARPVAVAEALDELAAALA